MAGPLPAKVRALDGVLSDAQFWCIHRYRMCRCLTVRLPDWINCTQLLTALYYSKAVVGSGYVWQLGLSIFGCGRSAVDEILPAWSLALHWVHCDWIY